MLKINFNEYSKKYMMQEIPRVRVEKQSQVQSFTQNVISVSQLPCESVKANFYPFKGRLSGDYYLSFKDELEMYHSEESIKIGGKSYTMYEDSQTGSNPAFWAKDDESGELFYVKYSNNPKKDMHIQSEYLSSKLYNLAGIKTPEVQLSRLENGDLCLMSKYVPDCKYAYDFSNAHIGFAVDAWLANWDSMIDDNTMLKDGEIIKIDCGGALMYRAMGGLKSDFNDEVKELITFVNGQNWKSKMVYNSISHADLLKSFEKVVNIKDEDIRFLVEDAKLADILINRKNYMKACYEKILLNPYDNKDLCSYFAKIL